jgi:hypothetical protein
MEMLHKYPMFLTEGKDILLYATENLFGCRGLSLSAFLINQGHSLSILKPYDVAKYLYYFYKIWIFLISNNDVT